jgi:hypothetical protein
MITINWKKEETPFTFISATKLVFVVKLKQEQVPRLIIYKAFIVQDDCFLKIVFNRRFL